jgi:hypothetical protein
MAQADRRLPWSARCEVSDECSDHHDDQNFLVPAIRLRHESGSAHWASGHRAQVFGYEELGRTAEARTTREQWSKRDGRPALLPAYHSAVRRRSSGEERKMPGRAGQRTAVPPRRRGEKLRDENPRRRASRESGPECAGPAADRRSWVDCRLRPRGGQSVGDSRG